MKILYAAYGSNLNLRQMSERCPDAAVYAKGVLKDYEMTFRGHPYGAVATVEPRKGSSVPILLWEISAKDEKALDRYEGWPSFYEKSKMKFDMSGKPVTAMIYVMTQGHLPGCPSDAYYETIREGYHDCGFDTAFLEKALERSKELMGQEQSQGSMLPFRLW